jgi:hypothetical protein
VLKAPTPGLPVAIEESSALRYQTPFIHTSIWVPRLQAHLRFEQRGPDDLGPCESWRRHRS